MKKVSQNNFNHFEAPFWTLKSAGVTIDIIVTTTGLDKEQIEKLR